jgi:hypothetical protein
MRWNKIFFLCYLLFTIWGCESPEGPPNWPRYIYGGKISDIEKIYVDKVSVSESLNVVKINLPLSIGNANKITDWTVYDPDDPATDTNWVDPNDEWWVGVGNDNGYIGSVELEDFFPVPLPTFHTTKSDAYNGEFPWTNFFSDEDGRVSLFMRVYPDISSYQGYHPGDNFSIQCVIGDTAYYSDTIYAWKRMRIEYDYMEGCTLSTVGFTTIERAFKGENVIYGGNRDYNHCTYLEFRDDSRQDSIHLWRSDKNFTSYVFEDLNSVTDFYEQYRDNSTDYPFYVVGACSLLSHPKTFGITLFFVNTKNPFISSVFVPKIINNYRGSLTSLNLKTMIGLVTCHELGHFAARLTDAFEEPEDHVDADRCIMNDIDHIELNLNYGQNMFFCPACIYRFRGNMYVGGPQVFMKGGEK